ncbi:MAG: hypothetical protein M0T85_16300 [Dehalococcoidales bacterium]|nr:hypothetical protein [Dehalococcoidales bacterium]
MANRRILVLYSKSLLAQGVENLLRKSEGLEVIGVDLEQRDAVRRIGTLQPEVVIVDGDDLPVYGGSLILQLLREHPSVKVLCISVNGNTVDIYRKSQMAVTRADELVAAINMD